MSPGWARALAQVVERERAKVGVLTTLADPTVTMRREAAAVGVYEPLQGKFARVQILTGEELFEGKRPHLPWIDSSVFRKARCEITERQGDLGV